MENEELVRVCLFVDVACLLCSVALAIMFYLLGNPMFTIIMLLPAYMAVLSIRKVLQYARRKKIRI